MRDVPGFNSKHSQSGCISARSRGTCLAALLAASLGACVQAETAADPACASGQPCSDGGAPELLDAAVSTFEAAVGVDAATPVVSDLPCEVKAVVGKHCTVCHSAEGSAPMALGSRADYLEAAPSDSTKTVSQRLPERLHSVDSALMMPPAGYARPSSEELATLDGWLERGAPAATAACAADDADAGSAPPPSDDLECYRFLAHDPASKTAKYKVGVARDVYVNMTFKAPWPETRYGVIMRPITDNAKVLHHWLLFQNLLPGVDGAVAPAGGAHPDGSLLQAWAPGGSGIDLRKWKDVAYELPGGDTTYTLEFHYNSSDDRAEDGSGVEICMLKSKPKNIAAVSWLGKDNLGLPESKWVATCAPLSQEPIRIMGVMPHMHLDGVYMKAVINRKDGSKEVLHDAPFDFAYQQNYDKDVTLMPGDTITTECTFKKPQRFGKATNEEMCYLFTYAYPKGALVSFDPWGAFAHGGSSCLGL